MSRTLLEKADDLTNQVEQMHLAHRIRDEARFEVAHGRASRLGFELVNALQETCKWKLGEYDVWMTECGKGWVFDDDDDNFPQFPFCPFCGLEIIVEEHAPDCGCGDCRARYDDDQAEDE